MAISSLQAGRYTSPSQDEICDFFLQALQCIAGLLESNSSSITLNERGDTRPLQRHPGFRLFAAMNPANDAGRLRSHISDAVTSMILRHLLSGCIAVNSLLLTCCTQVCMQIRHD